MNKSSKIIILISILLILIVIAIIFRTFIGNCFILAKIYIKEKSTVINFDNLYFETTIEMKSTGNSVNKYYFKDGNLKNEIILTYNDDFLKDFKDLDKQMTKIYYTNENSELEQISINGSNFEEGNELVSYEEIKKNLEGNLKIFYSELPTEYWKNILFNEIVVEGNYYKFKTDGGYTYINKDTGLEEKHVSEEYTIEFKYVENIVKDSEFENKL